MSLFDCFYECIYKLKNDSIICMKHYKIDPLHKPLRIRSHCTAAGLICYIVVTSQEHAYCHM